ncbi:glycoside hydrolase family 28 protein, partial sequence [Botrytis cinerea T4]|uniref:Glycoside hydrolase family 28 protein, partial sequence n=1 Tax=Botryotinia fuckeliana (strain T4) TaxID=999810 RepID=G2YAX4_BOTF4
MYLILRVGKVLLETHLWQLISLRIISQYLKLKLRIRTLKTVATVNLLEFAAVISSLVVLTQAGNGNGNGNGHEKAKTCTIPSKYKSSNRTADDSPAVAAAFVKCSSNSIIEFKKGVDYNIFSPISAKNLTSPIFKILSQPRMR